MRRIVAACVAGGLLPACLEERPQGENPPVGPELGPVERLEVHVSGFHYASGDMTFQMEVDHYCHPKGPSLIQCALYDGTGDDANLIGVEHIVSRDVFDGLEVAEKVLWHPHNYEVLSGALLAPELGPGDEHELMEVLVSTYGKTWHVWDPDVDGTPLGTPMLMKGFTGDGQLDPELLRARDERYGIDSAERRRARADIDDPGFDTIVLAEPEVCPPLIPVPPGD